MLPLLRRVQLKASVPARGSTLFRPYVRARNQGQAKLPYSSTTTPRHRRFPVLSKLKFELFLFASGVLLLVIKQYRKNAERLFPPPYLPMGSEREIRLLVLEPGKAGDPISCRLKHVLLSDDPKYEALSYVWGKGRSKGYIRCEGELVAIRKGLFDALEALREPDRERILWIDALCINQGDEVEKGHQVAIMGDIYTSSQQVLIWLGKGTKKTAEVFKTMKEVGRDLSQPDGAHGLGHSQSSKKEIISELDWRTGLKLFGHSYYHRVWTLQEMMMAPAITFVHGWQSVSLADYERAEEYLSSQLEDSIAKATGLTIDRDNSNMPGDGPAPYLEMVASNSPSRDATNPKDRIYAFRGISNDHDGSDWELFPDYTASVEEVYSRFARWCLVKNKDLTYLAHAGLPLQNEACTLDVPSWVTDWTRKERLDLGLMFSGNIHQYKAGSALKPSVLWRPNQPRLLFIKGRVVDTVAELGVNLEDLDRYCKACVSTDQGYKVPLWRRLLDKRRWVQNIEQVEQVVAKYGPMMGPPYMLTEPIWMEDCKAIAMQGVDSFSSARFDTFWRTFVRDRKLCSNEKAPDNLGNTVQEYVRFLDLVRRGDRWPSLAEAYGPIEYPGQSPPLPEKLQAKSPSQIPTESETKARFSLLLYLGGFMYKRFCSTTEGRLGFVPDCAQPGDMICVFDGADVPYVIRPRVEMPGKFSFAYWRRQLSWYSPPPVEARSDPDYLLVGECYVHGLMDGEAVTRKNLESKFIKLS